MTKEQLIFSGIPADGSIPDNLYLVVIDNDRKLIVDKNFREQNEDFKFDMNNELIIFTSIEGQKRIPIKNYIPFDVIQSIHFRK